ncbi:hypothetical protein B4U79_05332 [Dinothrombium tinctorium]|uniref:Trimethylguanosine synthase n=1 Tax=Dinothrombium tinctorium TaxID=1965070 RepID=A0A443RCV0_9ACAR|nr:hypothetical protein B4U79_05332 [Dinothrombium tinctorium]
MENTIIRTKALINDLNIHRQHATKSLIDVKQLAAIIENEEEYAVDSEEVKLMQAMGLPTSFSSSKQYYVSKISDRESDVCDWKALNGQYIDYWQKFGNDIVLKSWTVKYKDYINPDYFYSSEQSNTMSNCTLIQDSLSDISDSSSNASNDAWTEVWNKHYWSEYERCYKMFIDSAIDGSLTCLMDSVSIASEFANPNDENVKEEGTELAALNENDFKCVAQTSLKDNSEALFSYHEDECKDDPPDEKPIIKQDEHDTDSSNGPQTNNESESSERQTQKRKRKNRNKQSKHWYKRYRLFSRFDEGIMLDDESWYSVTPEKIAEHIAKRMVQSDVNLIIDGFCGAGGNTIQFALASPNTRVIAIDIDAHKIELAKHNAAIYGVEHQIDFIVANFLDIPKLLKVKVDAMFISPPWGVPSYKKSEKYCLDLMTPNFLDILEACRAVTPNFAFYLPRNIDENELFEAVKSNVEIEQNILNDKVLTVTAYFGNLIKFNAT